MNYKNKLVVLAFNFLLVFSAPAWSDIEFNDAYNFRDSRVNIPLTYSQDSDVLIFGINITDSDTGDVPDGAIVRAKNLETEEQFVMRRSGIEFWQILPYTPERAAGEWIVEIDSNVGSASALIPEFGTGPGTGPMPTVDNLASITGAQPQFNWALQADILSQNDGNVDRLRVRILDSNNNWMIDDRFDDTVTATTYTTEPGVITHNGAYVTQMMVEGLEPFNRSRNYTTFVVDNVGVGGEVVNFNWIEQAHDFRGANSVGWLDGDRQYICAGIDPFEDTFVHSELNGTVLQAYQQSDRLSEFCSSMIYDPTLTASWTMTAWNGAMSTTAQSNDLGPLESLPLVSNIRIEPDNLTPTIHWDLPQGNTVPFDEIQIGLFDDVTDFRLRRFGTNQDQLFDNLPTNVTSYKFEPGVLEENGRYVVRVQLIDRDDAGIAANRSLTFFNFTPIMETGSGEIFLPTLDAGGIYNFDFDVTEAIPVTIDPEVAVGYTYEIGDGDPRFASVKLPSIGDGLFDLTVFDDAGDVSQQLPLAAETVFDLTTIDSSGVSKFEVTGIEVSAGLDPLDVTAFMTTLTFASSGRFTGSMTPIVEEIEEDEALMCDADGDDQVDIRDIRSIAMMRNQPASGSDDPMDWDGNGVINALDARGCQQACTLPRCAIQ